ncbi:hypothetical protein RDWZM_003706 [Blomia tropicalis]|uniref:Uncharacterized protein n=1 Tax=Blomia tropicalis TaxID=40697 RepID=A0A9Q0RTA0_BLOTA|nr:hypothetical protein RDWZM_003706 [Blomia tropicalis]
MTPSAPFVQQIGALIVLLFGSIVIAFLPLSLLHYVYRKKRRRLRGQEFIQRTKLQLQKQQSSSTLNDESGKGHMPLNGKDRQTSSRRTSKQNVSSTSVQCDSHSSQCNSHSGLLYQQQQQHSETALASTMTIPSMALELIRSLDGGLLLATLFLILLPQLRLNFESFMSVHVNPSKTRTSYSSNSLPLTSTLNRSLDLFGADMTANLLNARQVALHQEDLQTSHIIASKSTSPVPLVELILCLAFFAIHFIEEFTQLCLRYRKYFWACNSSVVYSSANGRCEFSSLDYRISRTKRFLIDCSRKTSSTVSTGDSTSGTASSRTSNNASPTRSNELANNVRKKISFITDMPTIDKEIIKDNDQSNKLTINNGNKIENESAEDLVCANHNLDSLQLYPEQGINQDYEPNSLLSASSSSCLPSYYWPPTVGFNTTAQTSQSDSHIYNEPYCPPKTDPYNKQQQQQHDSQQLDQVNAINLAKHGPFHHHPTCIYHQYCCHNHDQQQYHQHQPTTSSSSSPSSENESNQTSLTIQSPIFTKIFLPHTTLATSTPALYICEGILIAIQPTISMLWLMLIVVLVHKLVTGLMVSFELHEKTAGRQRQLPFSTTFLFILLPIVGYLCVVLLDGFFILKRKDREKSMPDGTVITDNANVQLAAIKVILFAVSAATLLHLVLLIIQRNLVQLQPQLQSRIPSNQSSSVPYHPKFAKQSNNNNNNNNHNHNHHHHQSNDKMLFNKNIGQSSLGKNRIGENSGVGQSVENFAQYQQFDQEIVTNPPRYGVLHHFTMYTGFIIILLAIAFLNMDRLKM